jgi:heterodisulfide reductase subunit A-like polyferredoxin
MIQCVGSRDEAHPYCSRVCCSHAIKNALALKKLDPGIEVSILFRDIRTLGTQELYYQQARRLGVRFLRYEPAARPTVEADGDRLRVTVHDGAFDETATLICDLLALSTGIVPYEDEDEAVDEAEDGRVNLRLAEVLGVSLDQDGFFAEANPKLRPTDLAHPGIFLCGLAYGPRFVAETIAQARAAALRAALVVARPAKPRQDIATVETRLCSFCGLCVTACPYSARVLDEEERVACVLDYVCQGCGVCVAVCPNGASRQPAFEPVQALALVDAALVG